MTKSTITRERLQEIAEDGFLKHGESKELARMALAAMDSEPVAEVCEDYAIRYISYGPSPKEGLHPGDNLYRHAQPATEYPEKLPCPVLLEPGMRFGKGVKTRLVLEAIKRRAEHYAELEAMTPEERAEYDAGIEAFKAMLPKPVNVSPDFDTWFNGPDAGLRVVNYHIQRELQESAWNACRAAMLQPLHTIKAASALGSLPKTGEVLHANSPVIPDGYVMVPKEPTGKQWAAGVQAFDSGMDKVIRIYKAMLAAATQEVKGE